MGKRAGRGRIQVGVAVAVALLLGGAAVAAVRPAEAATITATAVSAGEAHTSALVTGGTVRCWGSNNSGQLGTGGPLTYAAAPRDVAGLTGATAVSSGYDHTCALLSVGTVKCWGDNGAGELGNGAYNNRSTPVGVVGLTGADAVATGWFFTCALLSVGTVKCWGDNEYGELGDDASGASNMPVAVVGLTGATAIAAGGFEACARLSTGAVKCWGYNGHGQLGDGTTTGPQDCILTASRSEPCSTVPVAVTGLRGATAVTVGYLHACARLSTETAKCWGDNAYFELDNGQFSGSSSTPTVVQSLTGITAVAAGGSHTCARLSTGAVKCWGYNGQGQVGDGGPLTYSKHPVAVAGLGGATAVSAGYMHTCALLSVGSVKCWGENGSGQLGNGTLKNSPVPETVKGF